MEMAETAETVEVAEIIHHRKTTQVVSNQKMTVENKKERGLNHKRKS